MPSTPKSDTRRLKSLIPASRKRIAVLGDLMLDRYLWGTASRLSPEAAVPVVDFVEQTKDSVAPATWPPILRRSERVSNASAQLAMTKQARRYAIACAPQKLPKKACFPTEAA